MTMPGSSASVSNTAVAVAPAAAYRVRIDFRPDGGIDRDVVDAIIADNVKAELTRLLSRRRMPERSRPDGEGGGKSSAIIALARTAWLSPSAAFGDRSDGPALS